jgi:23S rRNA-/tRNA-specific pseudouridylate synthase
VIFRDDVFVVLEKPTGMPTQSTRRGAAGTLEAWLQGQEGVSYTAFHHRLDAAAQGLICAGLDRRANKSLARAFRERLARRSYRALVHGIPSGDAGVWHHLQIERRGRRKALPWEPGKRGEEMKARWFSLEPRPPHCLITVSLETGKTHQIRLQAAAEGHPIVGDRVYGFGEAGGLRLQASELELEHPLTGERMSWSLEEPESWRGQ